MSDEEIKCKIKKKVAGFGLRKDKE